jgi:hypothetical protein
MEQRALGIALKRFALSAMPDIGAVDGEISDWSGCGWDEYPYGYRDSRGEIMEESSIRYRYFQRRFGLI